ncbi:MAG: DNA-binding transcriptional regulator [Kiritimatiellae bacterium]|jgi:LacI family transcriptional regulator|nr:DNA-binding transcriptional regulator [Kiritimatiellia bacterium]
MSESTQKNPQVAILLPSSVKVCRDMRRGILKYVRSNGPWGLHILEGREGEQKLIHMKEWGCTGIIGRPYTQELVDVAMQTEMPMILMEDPKGLFLQKSHPLARHSIVQSDTAAIGRLAATYFIDRKFQNFAYVGEVHDLGWSVKRGEAFAASVEEAGFKCHMYGALPVMEQEDAGVERDHLCNWLQSLPKPVALLAAMDNRARQVMDACAWSNISIPHDLAVLGVDNDRDLCENTTPAMSSILLNAERASYNAAAHLDQLMKQTTSERRIITYGPSHVVSRRSTAAFHIDDPIVAKAMGFISTNACSAINVPDVVRFVNASRRLTEMRFREALGHTILEEIRRVRLEEVCTRLIESDQLISEITYACGFDSESHLGTLFRRKFGCTMRDYRKNH